MYTDVRSARPADARSIARIHSVSWRVTYEGLLPESYLRGLELERLTRHWNRVLRRPSDDDTLVASIDGRIGGFATCGATRDDDDPGFAGELFMLYVDPDLERAGLGSRLIHSAAQRLAAHGHLWMVIWVVTANTAARAFYKHHGFRPDGAHRADRLGGGQTPTIRVAKPIGPVATFTPT